MKVVLYPAFTDAAVLADRYWRVVHYLGAVADLIERIDLHTNLTLPAAPPDYLDQTLPRRERDLRDRVRVRENHAEFEPADFVVVWDQASAHDAALRELGRIEVLDPIMLHEGDLWIELGARIRPQSADARVQNQRAVLQHLESARATIVNVFGAGPSLSNVRANDIPPGANVVCNSLVKNVALLGSLDPAIIAAVDPIFHAGASRHAEVFRRDLIAALRAHPRAIFVAQERDAHLYRATLPDDVRGRLATIPVQYGVQPNFDLARAFHLTATRNVLTLALLPLAANLGEEVRLYGCDGRPVNETSHFWGYDPASVFANELAQQQEAHPGFYTLDYREYYALHCETTRLWVRAMEARGQRVKTATPSYIPALAARAVPGVAAAGPSVPLSFQVLGRLAFVQRVAQSAYGSILASRAPNWAKRALRAAVAGVRILRSR